MPIQFLLTIVLAALAGLATLRRRRAPPMALLLVLVAAVGLVFVWQPDLATTIAGHVGVGRGADLIFYCFILLSIALSFWLYLTIQSLRQQITTLARELALATARTPNDDR